MWFVWFYILVVVLFYCMWCIVLVEIWIIFVYGFFEVVYFVFSVVVCLVILFLQLVCQVFGIVFSYFEIVVGQIVLFGLCFVFELCLFVGNDVFVYGLVFLFEMVLLLYVQSVWVCVWWWLSDDEMDVYEFEWFIIVCNEKGWEILVFFWVFDLGISCFWQCFLLFCLFFVYFCWYW